MELTIDQALQQGVAAHKEGNVQEAERLYRTILQTQPRHPDANHNLGLLAVSLNEAEAALPLFKTALEANPNIELFWLSYIDALLKEKQFDTARKVFEQGKKEGLSGNKIDVLEMQLAPITLINEPKLVSQKKNLTFSEKRKKLAESKKRRKAKKQSLKGINPPEAELKILFEHYQSGRYKDAEKLAVSITQQFPNHSFSWKMLGAILGQASRLIEALVAKQRVVELDVQDAEAHYNLGLTLQELGRLEAAEVSYRQGVALKPNFDEAHINLGSTLQALGRLEEAEVSYRQGIALKPNFADAHYNLGSTLQALGRLKEADASYKQAITLKPDHTDAHSNLGIVLYANGDIDSGIKSLEKANHINPKLDNNELILTVLRARKAREESESNAGKASKSGCGMGLTSNPLILNREVKAELITDLYEMNSRKLDKTGDARYGNGRCSLDFNLFDNKRPIVKTVAKDLISIMKLAVKSEIYVDDSFFNILGPGGGTTPHMHLNKIDEDKNLNLAQQKYSLVYYLSIGDQNCSEPGILKLYDPSEEILPCEGMIVIVPSNRKHSAVYGGGKDRIMIGINFYIL